MCEYFCMRNLDEEFLVKINAHLKEVDTISIYIPFNLFPLTLISSEFYPF